MEVREEKGMGEENEDVTVRRERGVAEEESEGNSREQIKNRAEYKTDKINSAVKRL
jgi:hypothetical protein